MKKAIAMLLVLSLALSSLALAAAAEETGNTDAVTSATQNPDKPGKSNRPAGENTPDSQNGNQSTAGHGRNGKQNGKQDRKQDRKQPAESGSGNTGNQQAAPGSKGRTRRQEGKAGVFQSMLKAGVIDRKTCRAILSWLQKNAGTAEAASGDSVDEALIQTLLNEGVITQAQYEAMLAYLQQQAPQNETPAPAEDGVLS